MAIFNSKLQAISLDSFPTNEVKQAFYTRHGGISPEPWSSLNHGGMLGDDRDNIIENRRRIFQHFGRPVESIYDVWQVHSAEVVCVDRPRPLNTPHLKADAILTNNPEITLMMRFADCVPILFYDPVEHVIGIAHAGWQGTVLKVAKAVIEKMEIHYGSRSRNILAGIGPSIGPECYEIGNDVAEKVQESFGKCKAEVVSTKDGKDTLDLWKANQLTLMEAGVEQIEISGICTACNTIDWYSHRAENGKTGRFGALISLM